MVLNKHTRALSVTHVVFYVMFVYTSLISIMSPIPFNCASSTALSKHLLSPCHMFSLEVQHITRAVGFTQATDRCYAFTGWRSKKSGFDSRQEQGVFLFFTVSIPALVSLAFYSFGRLPEFFPRW
jgi:hypothetical protein